MKSKRGGPHGFVHGREWFADREERLKACLESNATWAKLSPGEQLALLNARLGDGVGAGRQRERIAGALAGTR